MAINFESARIPFAVVDLPQALATIQNAIILVLTYVNQTTKGLWEKRSVHINVRRMQFHRLRDTKDGSVSCISKISRSSTAKKYPAQKTMEDYKTVTPKEWLWSLTIGVVHKRFHQQGFD